MKFFYRTAFALFHLPSALVAMDNSYPNSREINDQLISAASRYTRGVEYVHLGYSQQGRDLGGILIGLGKDSALRPIIHINGAHHGNEPITAVAVLSVLNEILGKMDEAFYRKFLTAYTILLQPVVNPDGYDARTRTDALGRDPNRDYAFSLRDETVSFSIPETRAIQGLARARQIRASLAFHSGLETVLWPLCFTKSRPEREDVYRAFASEISAAMGFNSFRQSFDDYPTRGEYIDFMYMKFRSLAFTVEISRDHDPPQAQRQKVIARAGAAVDRLFRLLWSFDNKGDSDVSTAFSKGVAFRSLGGVALFSGLAR